MSGLSILNFKKLVNQPFSKYQLEAIKNVFSLNLNISFVLTSFLEHLEINEHHSHDKMTGQHDCVMAILFQTFK